MLCMLFNIYNDIFNVVCQVYEVTIFEADDEDDSFDEDTEITEAVSLHTQKTHTYSPLSLCWWLFMLNMFVCLFGFFLGLLEVCKVRRTKSSSSQKLSALLDSEAGLAARRVQGFG